MRLLTLRFKNLNSLAGEWQIDFTHNAYQSNGLFAIVGTTGAGKSTLLDAICLALYGQTPRLGRITKSHNEIMSRHYGECFAEVEFSTLQGNYRCHWGQHRARKQASGELQSPQHEIVEVATGKVLANKIRSVHETLIAVSGLDFERFTRAILLAQGGFSAFLQAKPDERSPILEQLTGTKIYSQLSIKVAERRSEEAKKLKRLEAQLAGIQVLSGEEEQAQQAQLSVSQTQLTQCQKQQAHLDKAIAWHKQYEKNRATHATILKDSQQLQEDYQQYQSVLYALKQANKARSLQSDYHALNKQRDLLKETQNSSIQLHTELRKLKTHNRQDKQQRDVAKQTHQQMQQQQEDLRPILKLVRKLDTQQQSLLQQSEQQQKQYNTTQQHLAENKTQQSEQKQQQAANRTEWQQSIDYLEKHPEDKHLQHELKNLKTQLQQFAADANNLADLAAKIPPLQKLITAGQSDLETLNKTIAAKQQQAKAQQNQLQTVQNQLSQHLDNHTTSFWRQQLTTQEQAYNNQAQKSDTLAQLIQLKSTIQTTTQAHQTQLQVVQQLDTKCKIEKNRLAIHNEQVNNIKSVLAEKRSLKKIQYSLEEHRKQLQAHEACPLCGATEHPYVKQHPHIDTKQTSQQLDAATQQWQTSQQTYKDLLTQHSTSKEKLQRKQILLEQQQQQYQKDIKIYHFESDDLISQHTRLQQQQEEISTEIQQLKAKIKTIEHYEHKASQLHQDIARLTAQQRDSEQQQQKLALSLVAKQQEHSNLTQHHQQIQNEQQDKLRYLQQQLHVYQLEFTAPYNIQSAIEILTQRQQQWSQQYEQKIELEQQYQQQQTQYQYLCTDQIKLEQQSQQQYAALSQTQAEMADLKQQRMALFAQKSADEEEQQCQKQLDQAAQQYKQKRKYYETKQTEYAVKQQQYKELDKNISTQKQHITQQKSMFQQQLTTHDFVDETAYKQACLSESQWQEYSQIQEKLAHTQLKLDTLKQANQAELARLESESYRSETLSDVQIQATEKQSEYDELQQSIGAITQVLQQHKQQQKRFTEQLSCKDKQTKEYRRWDKLHQLIGSADGKKFRNFAQGLTFEIMISHANQQLQKMSERYLLIHSQTSPLELNVIDKHQAGEIRSIKNLSGGESFIVSLALALGLSQMASQNIQMDSLFLDEGFGSLDEDTLETVLEALSKLHQDSKIIGIISHVNGLKERISNQIEVIANQQGKSRLVGAGITHLKTH